MFKRGKEEAPRGERGGLVSSLLLREGDVPEVEMNVSWVEVEPGSSQEEHMHEEEQAYLVVSGSGSMRVGDEEAEVEEGDLVHVPSGISHGLTNASDAERLVYITVAAASEEEVL